MEYQRLLNLIHTDKKWMDMLEKCCLETSPVPEPAMFPSMDDPEQLSLLSAKLNSWAFSPFEFTEDELLILVYLSFEALGVVRLFVDSSTDKLKAFVLSVRHHYHPNAYHNFQHAVDVLQATYFFLSLIRVEEVFEPMDVLGLLIAALCHDVGHPGCNNFLLINAKTMLAKVYYNKSILENYHLMLLFHILEKGGFFGDMSVAAFQEMKSLITESILATDMAVHFDFIGRMKMRLQLGTPMSVDSLYDRILLSACILKFADISNIARPFSIHYRWVDLLLDEYGTQGRLERDTGLPVHLFGDRGSYTKTKLQVDFFEKFGLPLFAMLHSFFPQSMIFIDQIQSNKSQWLQLNEL